MIVTKKTQRKPKQQQVVTTTIERPFKRPRTDFSMARQIGAVAQPMTPEKKNFDLSASIQGAAATTWSAVTLINGIAQGATANTRIGRRLTLKSVQYRASFALSVGPVRVLVVYDHAPNGALPAITDIVTVNDFQAPMNLINNDRFMVLHDNILHPAAVDVALGEKWFKKLNPNLQNQWTNAATGTIADITTGAIYIATVSTTQVAMTFTTRVRFTDL